jgi:hypothetical protein
MLLELATNPMSVRDIMNIVGTRGVSEQTAKNEIRILLACEGYYHNAADNKYYKRTGPSAGPSAVPIGGGPSGVGKSAGPSAVPIGKGPSGVGKSAGPSAVPIERGPSGDHDQNEIDILLGLVEGAVSRKVASRALRLHGGNINQAAIYLLDNSQPADNVDDSDSENDQIAKFLKIVADSYAKTKK